MPSSLSWIDYDTEAQQRAQRILTLFKERDTRDELGFGPIRDSISDTLFPGTSILHTRLRYMLFIPWMYASQEDKHVPSTKISDYARREQINLAKHLKENTDGAVGIIGGDVGDKLKTLPSAIYWAGLGQWGLRVYPGTEGQYQRALDDVYRRRRTIRADLKVAAEGGDDIGGLWELGAHTFHPGLPSIPATFPEETTFGLTSDEARYLQERVRQSCQGSLLADLLAKPVEVSVNAPWEHPNQRDFRSDQRELLRHARLFSSVTHGAATLYNLMLAELVDSEDLETAHTESGKQWLEQLESELGDIAAWFRDIPSFWTAVEHETHVIGASTFAFVEQWVATVLEYRDQLLDSKAARQLIKSREMEKKKGNSRFTNARVRDQWGGSSGMRPMVYRWPNVQTYVADMAAALK